MRMSRRHKKRKAGDLSVVSGCSEYSYMSPSAAISYLSINGFLMGMSIREQHLADEAQKLAEPIVGKGICNESC